MKTLIAVRGVSNRGKSTSIKLAYQLLRKEYPEAIFDKLFIGVKDISLIVKINGVKIGIESQGDPGSRIFESLKLFQERNCRIIVCATRSRGKTTQAVSNLAKKYRITWIEKDVESESKKQNVRNKETADFIMSIIRKELQ